MSTALKRAVGGQDEGRVPIAEDLRESEGLNAAPIWFGPTERPLFGWLRLPDEAVAGVVLCRPIGLEALSAHRAYRCLAEQLADKGMVTLQFDYTGTGDSAGDPADVVGTGTWLSDIGTAIDFVRETGVSRIGVIGLRLGATLAMNAATGNDIEALVLWDPCETGRGFLREQHMLAASIGIAPGAESASVEGFEIPGLLLPRDLAEAIRALRVEESADVLALRLLLLTRPDRPSSANIQKQLSTQNVDYGDAVGQDQFIDVEPGVAVLPERVITAIVSWLSRVLDGAAVPTRVRAQPEPSQTAIVARPIAGRSIVERTVRIGADKLFGIVTEPHDAEIVPMPAVVFMNAGLLPHSGPARLWVEMARRWAELGVRVLRVDLGGLGDSPTRPGRRPDVIYPVEAIVDVVDVARFIAPEDPAGAVLVGLCSGGYHALEGALLLDSRRAWLVNPGLSLVPPEMTESGVVDSRRQAVRHNSLTRHLRANARVKHLSGATTPTVARWALGKLRLHMPAAGWWLLSELRLFPSSARALTTLAHRGTELLVVCGEPEFAHFATRSRGTLRRLERSGHCHFEVIKSMDHSLFNFAGRSELMDFLTAELVDKVVADFTHPGERARIEGSPTG